MDKCVSLCLLCLLCLALVSCKQLDEAEATGASDDPSDTTGKNERPSARGPTASKHRNFYDFKVKTIDGKEMELDEFRGQVLLVVNVASQCGFTDGHYKAMVRLTNTLSPTGKFTILGFPCNQFGAQEPDSEAKIAEFVKKAYNVEFPMFSKVNVMEPHAHEIFKYLQEKTGKTPNWNFWKYLINHKGDVIGVFPPWVDIEEVSLDVRGAVNDAVQADPHDKQLASGPPQREHEDYGDGAGGGLNIWSEGMPANKEGQEEKPDVPGVPGTNQRAERASSNPDTDTVNGAANLPMRPDATLTQQVDGRNHDHMVKPGLQPGSHDDL